MNVRIIPRLDIKSPNLVKGIHLEGIRVLGKPDKFAKLYADCGADELLYMDVVASLYERNSILDLVEKTSRSVFIPLTVGGGLRSIEDIKAALHAGADKVAINTAAIRRPDFINEAAEEFGSSTIVVSIEAKLRNDRSYEAYVDSGRERTHINVFDWAQECLQRGAGEIMITSIDQEGTGKGFDIELTRRISEQVDIPVIACGGAGTINDVEAVIKDGFADAVSIASILHYRVLEDKPDFKADSAPVIPSSNRRITPSQLGDVKNRISELGFTCR